MVGRGESKSMKLETLVRRIVVAGEVVLVAIEHS
jgi:hypothetical protein